MLARTDIAGYAARIEAAWNKTREGIFEVGRLLAEAKAKHPGEFIAMVESQLPFGISTAEKLMKISRCPWLLDSEFIPNLPTSWGALHAIATLPEARALEALHAGIIHPEMDPRDLAPIKIRARQEKNEAAPATNGGTIADLHTLIDAGCKFGCIYADPPWLYANQGTRAATSNHYEGMTVAQLRDLPIRELSCADAHFHLWTTNGFLRESFDLFDAWGFEFKSSFVWAKTQMGIGNYWRNSHEFLLTAVRGNAKRFNDKSLKSWLEVPRGKHSAKPEQVRAFLERASHGPYLELFGRRTAPNWTVWGNQIEQSIFNANVERSDECV